MRSTSLRILGLALVLAGAARAGDDGFVAIFDGKSPAGWSTNTGKPLPAANVQDGAINPHKAGGYLVVHEKTYGDFVLDFDYKLSKGCNSGVFVRVNSLKNPVMTGLEVAIDDTKGTGMHDTGAFYDLVPPKVNAQKPVGEWNHMTITAKNGNLDVVVNGTRVSSIELDAFDKPGKRDDGSNHKFKGVTIKELGRKGHIGFQDHGQDCWYKNIRIKELK